ncbi:MAG: SGNH/GDSL hydrolase family protein [Methylocystis sp.]|nr:SGNH/GDSL hydrolase family protein [Methylocystis sp.]
MRLKHLPVILAILVTLGCTELGAFLFLQATNRKPNIDCHRKTAEISQKRERLDRLGAEFTALDPHIGYGYGGGEPKLKRVEQSYSWDNGNVIYKSKNQRWDRPIILVLGGSTADGVLYGHSWPEELAKLLIVNNMKGTIINGSVGGFSTNQELLKLVRDGLEYNPDFVISYSGVNDRGFYGEPSHPMVHSYQKYVFDQFSNPEPNAFVCIFSNTYSVISQLTPALFKRRVSVNLGVASRRSVGQQYSKNIELMNAISVSQGARFYAFIQPHAFFRSRHAAQASIETNGREYVDSLSSLYQEIIDLPSTHKFIVDATGSLEKDDGVYSQDGIHLTEKGDRVVANFVFKTLEPALRNAPAVAPRISNP